ncbi:MAG: hypothetical protein II951_09075 [Bacteroidales bacterium]|nr:hypothetical protein [Bacteroidales bacterium]
MKGIDINLGRKLTEAEEEYVYKHLRMHIEIEGDGEIRDLIEMPKSGRGMERDFRIGEIPVLFPCSEKEEAYREEGGHIVFNHDLIKSSFYLLSCYQEYATEERDAWGRYRYKDSIQAYWDMARKPIVNYYFEWMVEGIAKECEHRGIAYKKISPVGGPSVHLTHDLDTLRYYTWKKSLFRIAQVIGLRNCDTSRGRLAKAGCMSILNKLGLRHDEKTRRDPYWTFERIEDNEAYLGYKSTWFLLQEDGSKFGPDYRIDDEDVKEAVNRLIERGNEVGVHTTINTAKAADFKAQIEAIKSTYKGAKEINRKHFLSIDPDTMAREMEKGGIKVDCTLGFSEHEGFRSSYCMPHYLFDHEGQRTTEVVEIPLAMMDVTVLTHRKLIYDEIFLTVGEMLDEVRRFGGVFSLLWHNSTFDETYYPGIETFYEQLHSLFAQYQLKCYMTYESTKKYIGKTEK